MPKRITRDDGWGRTSRFYQTKDGKFPSVTTILGMVAKPALINWAGKVEREMILELAGKMPRGCGDPKGWLSENIKGARAHAKKLREAGDIGTGAHALIEWELWNELASPGPRPQVPPESEVAFGAWQAWRKGVSLKPIGLEDRIWSARFQFAGTADLICKSLCPDGEVHEVIVDWKTGKRLYAECMLQMAAYAVAAKERRLVSRMPWALVLHLPKTKEDPGFDFAWRSPAQLRKLFRDFLAVRRVWQWKEDEGEYA